LLETSRLSIRYGEMLAVRDVSINVHAGEIVSIVGSNGAGKSTVIKAISRTVPISDGTITFLENRIDRLSSHQVVELGVVQVPEGRRLFPFMSVRENLLVASRTREAKRLRDQILQRVLSLLPLLKERENQFAGSLSGGEQQMLAIARGLMANPNLLMLDEPSLGLAPLLVTKIFGLVETIRENGVTVLLVEQNVTRALSLAHRGYVIENGIVALEGSGAELLQSEYLRKAYLGM